MVGWLVPVIITAFWLAVAVGGLLFAKGPNRGIVQCCLLLTSVCCWLFWVCCYMTQLNPLIGPNLSRNSILIIAKEWGNEIIKESS